MSLDRLSTVITFVISHQTHEWSESGIPFLIAKTASGSTIKGDMYDPVVGENYTFFGEWKVDKNRGETYFGFVGFDITIDGTSPGTVDYLKRYVPNLGPARTQLLVDRHGPDVLTMLRDDPSIVLEIPGMTRAHVDEIAEHFERNPMLDPIVYGRLYDLMAEHKPPQSTIVAIIKDWGSSAVSIIEENPYILTGYAGLGFDRVDKIATQKLKYDKKGILRFRAGIAECLRQAATEGHTCMELPRLKTTMQELVGYGPLMEALEAMTEDGEVERDTIGRREIVADYKLSAYERIIARRLKELHDSAPVIHPECDTTGLEGEQVDALPFIMNNPVSLLVGPPGVGKTYVQTKAILGMDGRKILSTPTGKAAKRASEVLEQWSPNSGVFVSTMHRVLGARGGATPVGVPQRHARFLRGRQAIVPRHDQYEPLEVDVAVLDESSMIDAEMGAAYLQALPNGCRLLFTGDQNQLASVGPGSILRDMLDAGIPSVQLTVPRRNSGQIVEATHAIFKGKTPKPSKPHEFNLETGRNWAHIELSDSDEIAAEIVSLHDRMRKDRDPLRDCQVLSPQRDRLPIACDNLNHLLSRHLNAFNHAGAEEGLKFTVLDKVVRRKNAKVPILLGDDDDPSEYEYNGELFDWGHKTFRVGRVQVVNGDFGQIMAIVKVRSSRQVIVQFRNPDRLCKLPYAGSELELAYASTIHTFQGSGSPIIIAPVHSLFNWNHRRNTGLWCREMIYTLFSRAEESLITVGQESSIELAIGRKTIRNRNTRLARMIREEFARKELEEVIDE